MHNELINICLQGINENKEKDFELAVNNEFGRNNNKSAMEVYSSATGGRKRTKGGVMSQKLPSSEQIAMNVDSFSPVCTFPVTCLIIDAQ